jgi:UDP-glucose 4-epimerase
MRILVTGGAGFIASHVADRYIELGHEVSIVDDLSRGSRHNINPHARFYEGDIRDRDFLDKVFAEVSPQIVNHHAAQMDVRRGVREPLFDASVNIMGSLNLLESAVTHHTPHFIYISSAGAAYGEPAELPVREDFAIHPITPYGISKHTVEHYLYTFAFLYGLSYVVLRYGNVYGPRQSSKGEAGVFAIFCEQMLAGIQPVIYGDGSKARDYVYIDDVVEANVAALHHRKQEIFNIASGVPTTDEQVFRAVQELTGEAGMAARYAARRPGEIERIYLDISKARRMLGWEPTVSFAKGAQRTFAFFQRNAEAALAQAG